MDKEEIQKREVYYHRYLITINNQKIFKRVIYELCEINHGICLSLLIGYILFLFSKRSF